MLTLKIYTILIILGIHVLCALLVYFFGMPDSVGKRNESLAEKNIFLMVNEHPAVVSILMNKKIQAHRFVAVSTISNLIENTANFPDINLARSVVLLLAPTDGEQLDETNENLGILTEQLPISIPTIWFAVPPVDDTIKTGKSNERIGEFNRRIRQLCAARENCNFIDLTDQFADSNGNLKPVYHTGDGVTFNKTGTKIWMDALESIVSF